MCREYSSGLALALRLAAALLPRLLPAAAAAVLVLAVALLAAGALLAALPGALLAAVREGAGGSSRTDESLKTKLDVILFCHSHRMPTCCVKPISRRGSR